MEQRLPPQRYFPRPYNPNGGMEHEGTFVSYHGHWPDAWQRRIRSSHRVTSRKPNRPPPRRKARPIKIHQHRPPRRTLQSSAPSPRTPQRPLPINLRPPRANPLRTPRTPTRRRNRTRLPHPRRGSRPTTQQRLLPTTQGRLLRRLNLPSSRTRPLRRRPTQRRRPTIRPRRRLPAPTRIPMRGLSHLPIPIPRLSRRTPNPTLRSRVHPMSASRPLSIRPSAPALVNRLQG